MIDQTKEFSKQKILQMFGLIAEIENFLICENEDCQTGLIIFAKNENNLYSTPSEKELRPLISILLHLQTHF